ncbi:chemotaxis protein CheW [Pontixanthobacter aestiaquae]|uniref:Chemotaxis protein CheW n=1 Tax=Pontixanthobacter aestiaquae TaxID=1509367 RepID=A0A844Z7L4_9SPHN|nr:chemotaxis protein CheW [Pontixanthobacter aestiaquae]MDN3646208.1 chemotaxis protein CheW [Pontixanthobacter aestiaquae]MXO82800.1 chemotaxis protein CheW [Pontixanthobacter aestiaquae]
MRELILMFDIAGRRVAIPAVEVQSVIELEDIYPVPRAPDYVTGLTAMRSQSLTVIDCRKALGQESKTEYGERSPVIELDGHLYALLVDSVDDVVETQSEITPVAGGFGKEWENAAQGMVETDRGPTLLIDIHKLIGGQAAIAA